MGYKCRDCGNEDSFNAQQSVTKYVLENVTIDSEGSVTDYGDYDENDSEIGDITNITCDECSSSNVGYNDEDAPIEDTKVKSWKERLK